jgi:hypothetical protein
MKNKKKRNAPSIEGVFLFFYFETSLSPIIEKSEDRIQFHQDILKCTLYQDCTG